MIYKSNLHLHTNEDAIEGPAIPYTIYEAIDQARYYGFKVLALTGHKTFLYRPAYGQYAASRGIVLIPGIELWLNAGAFRRNDVVVLNCGAAIEKVKTLDELASYKRSHPEVFVIAPHPLHGLTASLGKKNLLRHLGLFDAIEHSWFYAPFYDPNRRAREIAERHGKPFIATSDSHTLNFLNSDYALISADELSLPAIFGAIRRRDFRNISRPKTLRELAWLAGHEYRCAKFRLRRLFQKDNAGSAAAVKAPDRYGRIS